MITKVVDLGSSYELHQDRHIFYVPKDSANAQYQEILKYISAGGIVEDAPPVPKPDYREKRKEALITPFGGFEGAMGEVADALYWFVKANPTLNIPPEMDALVKLVDKIKKDIPKDS